MLKYGLLLSLLLPATALAKLPYSVYRTNASSNTADFGQILLSSTNAVTGILPNVNTTATSSNTNSAIVARDGSGNFSATTITAALNGNANSCTMLQTARTINGVSFDGTGNIVVTAAAGTLTGTTLNSTVVSSSLTSVGTLANLTVTNPIVGSVTGNASTVTTNANLTGPVTSVGNATTITPVISAGSCTNCDISYNAAGQLIAAANGSGGSSGTGNLNAKFDLEGATTLYTAFGGNHRQVAAQSLTTVNLSMLNCGSSGTTTVRLNQYRNSSTATNTATATIAASIDPNGPCSASASLSGTLTILIGDIITVDVTGVASGLPENLTVEY